MLKQMIGAIGLLTATTLAGCSCNGAALEATDDPKAEARISSLTYYVAAGSLGPEEITYVSALNQDSTWCLGNIYNEACPIETIDFTHSGLNNDDAAKYTERFMNGYGIVEGWMERVSDGRGNYVSKLFVVTPWQSAINEQPKTSVYEVTPVDIHCVRAPCPTLNAQLVNQDDSTLLHGVDLEASGANDNEVVLGNQLLEKTGILISGEFAVIGEDTGTIGTELDRAMDGTDTMVMYKSDLLPGSKILVSQTFYTPAH